MSEKRKIRGIYLRKIIKEVDDVNQLYDKGYYDGDVYPEYTLESNRQLNERRITLVKRFWNKPSKILDVGCAKGFFLQSAKKAGFDPYGIDISSYAIDEAKKTFDGSVFCGNAEENIPFSDGFFEVITCWDVLEHFKNPFLVLKTLAKKLKKGGLIFIETCNYDSISRILMKGNWPFYGEGYHQTPEINSKIIENWLRTASLAKVEIFTDCVNVPLNDQMTKVFHINSHKDSRPLYLVRLFEYAVEKSLAKVNPNLGDLLFCVAKNNA